MIRRVSAIVFFVLLSQHIVASDNEEFRATWVITWEHINRYWTASQNKAEVRRILDNHKKANMNAALWQCRQSGTAYYNSSYEPWGYYAGYSDPGYDPLAYAIQEAHKRGLELHAWFNVFQTSSTYPGAPAAEHPEWICRDRDGNPMTESRSASPGLAAVREYTINVAMEIVRNYDIDGLHLDYVRWNEYSNSSLSRSLAKAAEEQQLLDGMISEEILQDLAKNQSGRYLYDIEHPYSAGVPAGFTSWEDWWRWSVTEFVRVLHDSIQAVKPWVRLSPAALGKYNWSGWQGYGTVYQDAALWFNEGYIDQLTPMHYHWLTGSDFVDMLTGSSQSWGPYIQKGIGEGRLFTVGPGSYQFADNKVWGRHPQVVEACRTVPWVDGFQFFSYGSWNDYSYWETAKSSFFNRKTKIRSMRLTETPDAPSLILNKIDSLNYEISVTPPTVLDKDYWFVIYRSEDDILDVGEDDIVHVRFGRDEYSASDLHSGLQDFDGQYRYYASMLNRYWNESDPSNVQLSDPIPSFPPTVVSTTPAEDGLISINGTIEIRFSKTMDPTTLPGAICIVPSVDIAELEWTDGNKTVTIETNRYFEFDTEYVLTIDPAATDVNGRPIDGNGDGVGGDVFVLNFRSKAVDDIPPKILLSYPDQTSETDDFDVSGIITFLFDELIDPNTLDDNSVSLYLSSIKIPVNYLLSSVDSRSVLSIQPNEPLDPSRVYSALLTDAITDTSGNHLESYVVVNFRTSPERYSEVRMIDDFANAGDWRQPSYSGSTTGIVVPETNWAYTNSVYLPSTTPAKAAMLEYAWDDSDSTFLLREYLAGGAPREVEFDTTYILQCYIFGDGSNNELRFCVDDSSKDEAAFHEVSKWMTLDWYGWRLVEWKLNDPASVGEWIGDGVLHGPSLRIDSFQLTHKDSATSRGVIYFDDLRLAKKTTQPVGVVVDDGQVPAEFTLSQNYPNPFNPITMIAFSVTKGGSVQLVVYDVLGREVSTLVDEWMPAGRYKVPFDGSGLPSGTYFYRLISAGRVLTKQMLLMR